jgi:hypothetical protein
MPLKQATKAYRDRSAPRADGFAKRSDRVAFGLSNEVSRRGLLDEVE